MRLQKSDADVWLTAAEREHLQALARSDGPSAAGLWLKDRLGLEPIDIHNQLAALTPPIVLAPNSSTLTEAYQRSIKRATIFVVAFLFLGSLVGLLAFESKTFVTLWWPGCLLLLLAAWLYRPAPYGHPGLIMIGIVLIPVSGVVAVALGESQQTIPILGLPLIVLCLICMAYGMAETLFAKAVPPAASSPDQVPARRLSRRIARIVLASYVLAPILALNHHLAGLDGIDETGFNALFRFALFLIVAAPVTALFCVPLGHSALSGFLALVTPLVAAAWAMRVEIGSSPSLLLTEAAVIQLLAVYLTVIGSLGRLFLSRSGRSRLARAWGIYLLLALGLTLGGGALRILAGILVEAFPHRDLADWLWLTAVPAALIALAVIRRGDFDVSFVR